MDDFIKKHNIPGIAPTKVNKVQEAKPVVKEAIGNFFETMSNIGSETLNKETLELQIASVKRQSRDLQVLLDSGISGKKLNVIG